MENFRIFDFEVDSHVEKNLAAVTARAIDKHGRELTPPFKITPGSTGGFCCFEDSAGVFGDVSKDGRLTVRWTNKEDTMENWVMTDHWARYESEAPSCGATLRVFFDGVNYLLVRADAWSGEFNEVLSSHQTLDDARVALGNESLSN